MAFIKNMIKALNRITLLNLNIPFGYAFIMFTLVTALIISPYARVGIFLGAAISAISYYIGKLKFNVFSKKVSDVAETMYNLDINTTQDLGREKPFMLEIDIDIKKSFIDQLISSDYIKVIDHYQIDRKLKVYAMETEARMLTSNSIRGYTYNEKKVFDALDNIYVMTFPDFLKEYKNTVEKLIGVQIVDTTKAYALYNSLIDDLFVFYVPRRQKVLFKEILAHYFANQLKLNFSYSTLDERDKQIELYTSTLKTMATYALSKSKKKKDIIKYASTFNPVHDDTEITTSILEKVNRSDFESIHYLKTVNGTKMYFFEIHFLNELLQKRFENKTLYSIFKDAYKKLSIKTDYDIVSNSSNRGHILSSSNYVFPDGLNIAEITNKVQEEIDTFYKSQQTVIYDYIKSNVREKFRS